MNWKRPWFYFFLGAALFIFCLAQAASVQAGYCAECHLLGESHTLGKMAWRQPLLLELETPCPGVRLAKTRLALFEARLMGLAYALKCEAPGWGGCDSLRRSLDELDLFYAKSQGKRLGSMGQMNEIMDELDTRLSSAVMLPLIEYDQSRAAWAFWLIIGWLATVLLVLWMYRQKNVSSRRGI